MATPYVRFSRGTPSAYSNLAVKNKDTLYFITDTESNKSKLYLGDDLISSEITKLSELEDLLIANVEGKELLVYDADQKKWVNKSVVEAIGVMAGASAEAQGKAGLVPAPAAGQEGYFLRGDGTWAQVEVGSTYEGPNFFSFEWEEDSGYPTAGAVLTAATIDHPENYKPGDIAVVYRFLNTDDNGPIDNTQENWAFVRNKRDNWNALDSNYSADNVYFEEDLIVTEKIGTIQTLTNGQAVLPAKGKTVKQVMSSLLAAPKNPTVVQPSVSISMSGAGTKEVGTQVTPSYSVTFNKGSYSYGPDTGITATYSVTDSNSSETQTGATGSFPAITIGDTTDYTVTVVATYTEGAVPKNNLGDSKDELKIAAGSKTASASTHFKGYRKSFYGTTVNKTDAVDSALIRELAQSSTSALTNGSEFTVNVPAGAMRVVIAYPATLRDVDSIKNVNGLNAESKSAFTKSIVSVEGANGYEGIDYKIYVTEYANATTESNSYKVKI